MRHVLHCLWHGIVLQQQIFPFCPQLRGGPVPHEHASVNVLCANNSLTDDPTAQQNLLRSWWLWLLHSTNRNDDRFVLLALLTPKALIVLTQADKSLCRSALFLSFPNQTDLGSEVIWWKRQFGVSLFVAAIIVVTLPSPFSCHWRLPRDGHFHDSWNKHKSVNIYIYMFLDQGPKAPPPMVSPHLPNLGERTFSLRPS